MATSQDYTEIRSQLGINESMLADAGDELMLLLSRTPDITGAERAELLGIHQRLVQPKAELDHTAEVFAAGVARWRFTPAATLSRIAAAL